MKNKHRWARRLYQALLVGMLVLPMNAMAGFGQIRVQGKSLSMKEIIRQIEKNSQYTFFYKSADVENLPAKTANIDGNIETVLEKVFGDNNIQYKIKGNEIILTTARVNQGKKVKITGQVTDKTGEPVIGASVIEKGNPANGTITNVDGKYSLSVPEGATLTVSYVGYASQEVRTKAGVTSYKITLQEDSKLLNEVVVVGYTTQKKESLTGALQTVKDAALKDVTTPSVSNMLNGKVAGVYVAPGSGRPGDSGAVVIRGQATLSGSTSPLWVVDGVIVGTDPGQINPNDIESMTVLKDAASTAVYGSEGANGVIVVTTKAAKGGKIAVSASAKLGVSKLNNGNLEVMNGAELYDYFKSFSNASTINFPRWNEKLRDDNFDWWNIATKTGFTQDYNVSIQGGSEKIRSYFSVGVYDETGAVKGYDYTRYNFRVKTTYDPYKWLRIKPSISGSKRDIDNHQYSVGAMYSMLPWDSPYDSEGKLVPNRYSGWVNNQRDNYLLDLEYGNGSKSENYEFMGNLDFDITLTNWLKFSSVNNYRFISNESAGYEDPRSVSGENVNGRVTDYRYRKNYRYTNQLLKFNKMWGKHSLNGLLAYEFKDSKSKTLDVYGSGIISGLKVLDIASKPEKTKGNVTEWSVQSYFFDAYYSYDNKYLAEISFRRDGASNFGDNAKYGNFFSISGGWNVNREKWFNIKAVDNLKLRGSFGSVGNRPSSLYPQYNLYSASSSYSYDGVPGVLISQIGNPDLTWEKTFTTGLGFDLSMFDSRFNMNFDWYLKNTDNILYKVPVSGLTGVTSIWKNIGKMRNIGFELNISGDIIRTKDFKWNVSANLGHNSNTLRKLYQTKLADGTVKSARLIVYDKLGIAGSANRLLEVGKPVDTYYIPKWAGVNSDNGAPMWYRTETKSDGTEVITTTSNYAKATYYDCGTSNPKLFGGLFTSLNWKNIDVNASFGYSIGGHIFNYSRLEYDSDGAYVDRNQMKLKKGWKRWEKKGDNATHPVAAYNNKSLSNKASSRFIENNSFFKLRSLTIGYTLPMEKYNIKNLRFYLAGENLFTITDYSGVDPELPSVDGSVMSSTGPSVYPSVRKFMFGVNLTF